MHEPRAFHDHSELKCFTNWIIQIQRCLELREYPQILLVSTEMRSCSRSCPLFCSNNNLRLAEPNGYIWLITMYYDLRLLVIKPNYCQKNKQYLTLFFPPVNYNLGYQFEGVSPLITKTSSIKKKKKVRESHVFHHQEGWRWVYYIIFIILSSKGETHVGRTSV